MTAFIRSTSDTTQPISYTRHVGSIIFKVTHGPNTSSSSFRHPKLTNQEMRLGCRLGIDSWADTCCSGKHARVIEFVDGRSVTANGFANSLEPIRDLSIANVAYAFDAPTGETLIFVVNNSIYLGELMTDSLLNPIQCMQNGIRIDIRPRQFYPEESAAQTFSIPSLQAVIPVEYDGVLPFLTVRRPTDMEYDNCTHMHITSDAGDWVPHCDSISISQISLTPTLEHFEDLCSTHSSFDDLLMHRSIGSALSSSCLMHERIDDKDTDYATIQRIATNRADRISPEYLSRLWRIGLATAVRTLDATTHQCLRTTGLLTRRFQTDKAHM